MLGLPKTTEFNKRIPKQKFYENLTVTPGLKRAFTEQVKIIWWRNKIAAATVNLAPGDAVTEIEVLELRLNQPSLDESVLLQIDREIPYHILFLLERPDGSVRLHVTYKEASQSGSNAFQLRQSYHTEWSKPEDLSLNLTALDMDALYESIVRQIAGDTLQADSGESLKESVERDEKKKQLEKQIAALENKMRREKQLNRQMEMNAELKKLRKNWR